MSRLHAFVELYHDASDPIYVLRGGSFLFGSDEAFRSDCPAEFYSRISAAVSTGGDVVVDNLPLSVPSVDTMFCGIVSVTLDHVLRVPLREFEQYYVRHCFRE